MPSTNPFASGAFSAASLTDAINRMPVQYGRLNQLGLFVPSGVATTVITVEERNGVLNLLPTAERGGEPTAARRGSRTRRSFEIPHIPHVDHIKPDDVQNVLAFGSENRLETLAEFLAERQMEMRAKHEQTLEHLRIGALKGSILDADGSTELFDLYTEFGRTQKTVDFVLGTATTNIRNKTFEAANHIKDNLGGELMNGIHVLAGQTWFEKFIDHAKVKEAYERWQQGAFFREDVRNGFAYNGITFEEYRVKVTAADGSTVVTPIADDVAYAYPVGTRGMFRTYIGPGTLNEAVNRLGQMFYSKITEERYGRGYDLYTESNPLPLCLRPDAVVKLTTSN